MGTYGLLSSWFKFHSGCPQASEITVVGQDICMQGPDGNRIVIFQGGGSDQEKQVGWVPYIHLENLTHFIFRVLFRSFRVQVSFLCKYNVFDEKQCFWFP